MILTRPRFRDACAVFEQPTSLRGTAASLNYAAAEPLYCETLDIWRRSSGRVAPRFCREPEQQYPQCPIQGSYG